MKEITPRQMENVIQGLAGRGMTEDQLILRFDRHGFTEELSAHLRIEIGKIEKYKARERAAALAKDLNAQKSKMPVGGPFSMADVMRDPKTTKKTARKRKKTYSMPKED